MMNSIELNTFLNHCPAFCTVLNTLGLESANAQTLHEAITSQHCLQKHLSLVASGDRSLETYYFIFEMGNKLMNCCGYLRIGKRHLYYMMNRGKQIEMDPICVLDFYVCDHLQRTGIGESIFRIMLADKQVQAKDLAYDRPSSKLLPFLRKHFGLKEYVPQYTNYIVFDDYFVNEL